MSHVGDSTEPEIDTVWVKPTRKPRPELTAEQSARLEELGRNLLDRETVDLDALTEICALARGPMLAIHDVWAHATVYLDRKRLQMKLKATRRFGGRLAHLSGLGPNCMLVIGWHDSKHRGGYRVTQSLEGNSRWWERGRVWEDCTHITANVRAAMARTPREAA